jgi:hypothetical protein
MVPELECYTLAHAPHPRLFRHPLKAFYQDQTTPKEQLLAVYFPVVCFPYQPNPPALIVESKNGGWVVTVPQEIRWPLNTSARWVDVNLEC